MRATVDQAHSAHAARHLQLAPHVRACESDGQVILLDLRHNRYLGVGGRHVARLAGVIDGWPAPTLVEGAPISATDADELTRPLLAKGLLTTQPFEPAPRAVLEEATTSLNALDLVPRPSVGVRRVHRFLYAAIAAALRLRHQSLFTVATALQNRRERCGPTACPRSPGQLRDAVAAYETLRPFVFTARDRCLYDSLALVNFLAGEGMFPRWVIGVKTLPFGAHSWVQEGGIVLNDQHELVRRFQPILVV